MIVLIGASASGKSTIEKALGYDRVISYTTRPIRPNEMDGVDYHYISQNDFNHKVLDGFFAESTLYNNWCYGMAKEDCNNNKLVVVEPWGFRQIRKMKDIHITSFLIEAPERQRVCRMMKRGDDLMESFRRCISDQGSFNGIWDEIDYHINNEDGKLEQAIQEIKSILSHNKEIK